LRTGIKELNGDDIREQEKSPDTFNPETLTVEESFALLKDILAQMDSEEITLEESFASYEKGIRLVRHCSETIDRVEKKVLAFQENGELYEF
jgi:exodeoxyribonuclease VII small subunit